MGSAGRLLAWRGEIKSTKMPVNAQGRTGGSSTEVPNFSLPGRAEGGVKRLMTGAKNRRTRPLSGTPERYFNSVRKKHGMTKSKSWIEIGRGKG